MKRRVQANYSLLFNNNSNKPLNHERRAFFSTKASITNAKLLNEPLSKKSDPELFEIFEAEKARQRNSVCLIASENFIPKAVCDALGSHLSNKYSEGYAGARYYAGNEHIDRSERLCIKRALDVFSLSEKEWHVNVQSLSGSPANFQVYSALLKPHERIMGLDLPHGGHLSHGFFNNKKRISATSIYFESMPYRLNEKTALVNYDELEYNAKLFRPQIIIAGASAYSRLLDYERFRKICDSVGAILMADMAHISGLVAAKQIPSPFDFADIVTTTTHKSLRGPRGAMIFSRKLSKNPPKPGEEAVKLDFAERIDFSVFPGLQGGPHNHTIAALAAALKMCTTKEYVHYQKQVIANAKALAGELQKLGYKIVSGGTDNHLLLVDTKNSIATGNKTGVDGARAERVLELVSLITNKNTIPGDTSALIPGGIRLGTPAFTSRGATEEDFVQIARFFHRAISFAATLDAKVVGSTKLADYKKYLDLKKPEELKERFPVLAQLRKEVEAFAHSFPTVGFEESSMEVKGNLSSSQPTIRIESCEVASKQFKDISLTILSNDRRPSGWLAFSASSSSSSSILLLLPPTTNGLNAGCLFGDGGNVGDFVNTYLAVMNPLTAMNSKYLKHAAFAKQQVSIIATPPADDFMHFSFKFLNAPCCRLNLVEGDILFAFVLHRASFKLG